MCIWLARVLCHGLEVSTRLDRHDAFRRVAASGRLSGVVGADSGQAAGLGRSCW